MYRGVNFFSWGDIEPVNPINAHGKIFIMSSDVDIGVVISKYSYTQMY